MLSTIGFVPAKTVRKQRPERDDLILRFDSGAGISRAEGCHNTAILGSTGSGKTTSGILPVAMALLKAGFGGLVIDVKGNLTNAVRLLAARCGRAEDIVEFGSGPRATPVNLLAHMDMTEVHDLFRIMATREFALQSHNLDWHLKGVRIAADCVEALRYGHEKFPAIPTDIGAVEALLNDYALAAKLFKLLKRALLDPANKRHARFISLIEQEQFHVLSYASKKANGVSSTYAEQTTWRLSAIRNGLDAFRKAPGIMRNFSASDGGVINLKRLIYDEKRIVVLRFDVASGSVGSNLSRHILERFYQTTYENGLGLSEGEHTFMLADEVQEITDLSPFNRMNDNSFAAKAREYKVIQVIGTQSLAALTSRGATQAAVCEYLNNFNNRITMYCDDPLTQDMTMRHIPDISLTRLGPGQCLVTRFDLDMRRHVASVESLQQAHDAMQAALHQPEFQEENDMGQAVAQSKAENAAPELSDVLVAVESEVALALVYGHKETKMKDDAPSWHLVEEDRGGRRRSKPDAAEDEDRSERTMPDDMKPALRNLIERRPQFFRTVREKGTDKPLHVPTGWLPALERALEAMERIQLDLDIQGFSIHSNALTVSELSRHGMRLGEKLCNRLLLVTREICPLCGKRVVPANENDEIEQSFCGECLEHYDLMPVHPLRADRHDDGFAGL